MPEEPKSKNPSKTAPLIPSLDPNDIYNEVDSEVQTMLRNWAKSNGMADPEAIGIDELSCSIAGVYGAAIRAALAKPHLQVELKEREVSDAQRAQT